jgi:hypothetical protein
MSKEQIERYGEWRLKVAVRRAERKDVKSTGKVRRVVERHTEQLGEE